MKNKKEFTMNTYKHQIQYYETDKMQITHHSNYIRFMEEARIDFLNKIGFGYDKMEELGISSPVIGIQCDYKKSTTFPDIIEIETKISAYKGTRLEIEYTMKVEDDIVAVGKSRHCFLNQNGRPIILKKHLPELDCIFNHYLQNNEI